MYNKLFTKILDSSVWLAPSDHRVVWITLLAAMDEDGFARFAAVGNLANRARVSVEDTKAALAAFEAPDPESGDPDNEGRRIERVPGGWMVLNAEKYRELFKRETVREQTRQRNVAYRERKKAENGAENGVTDASPSVTEASPIVTETQRDENVTPSYSYSEAYSEAEAEEKNIGSPDGEPHSGNARERVKSSEIDQVFNHWKTVHPHPRSVLTKPRRALIAKALTDYSADTLCEAISGYRNSPHHMGRNERSTLYDSIELMLRDAKHIDAGLTFFSNTAPPDLGAKLNRGVAATANWIANKGERK